MIRIIENLTIKAKEDEHPLSLTHFKPPIHLESKGLIMLAGATAVPKRFYRDISEFLAFNGYEVINFDYRGVGSSTKNDSFNEDYDFFDMAFKDYSAVIDYCLENSNLPVASLGHSFGALCFGVNERSKDCIGLYAFGSGSGARKFLSLSEKIKADLLWFIAGPLALKLYGYVPKRLVGMGANIPKSLFYQWRSFYIRSEFWMSSNREKILELAKTLNVPIKVVNANDDPWTNLDSAKDYYKFFENSDVELIEINSNEQKIGHLNYFRDSFKEVLWSDMISWFNLKFSERSMK